MLPLWWPRVRCIYCGRRIEYRDLFRHRDKLACDKHVPLLKVDPLTRPRIW